MGVVSSRTTDGMNDTTILRTEGYSTAGRKQPLNRSMAANNPIPRASLVSIRGADRWFAPRLCGTEGQSTRSLALPLGLSTGLGRALNLIGHLLFKVGVHARVSAGALALEVLHAIEFSLAAPFVSLAAGSL